MIIATYSLFRKGNDDYKLLYRMFPNQIKDIFLDVQILCNYQMYSNEEFSTLVSCDKQNVITFDVYDVSETVYSLIKAVEFNRTCKVEKIYIKNIECDVWIYEKDNVIKN